MDEPGVVAIRKRLAPPSGDTAQDKRVARLIALLDADAYMEREKAMAALRDIGAAAEPGARTARPRENTSSLEVRVRIDKLLDGLHRTAAEDEAGRRMRRLVEVLELVGGQEARTVLADVASARRPRRRHEEAKAAIQRLDGKAEIPTKLDLPLVDFSRGRL